MDQGCGLVMSSMRCLGLRMCFRPLDITRMAPVDTNALLRCDWPKPLALMIYPYFEGA
jgi:hypothetical protein